MREIYRFGPYRLDVDARRLTKGQSPVSVTLRGFDLLLVLVRQAGTAVPRSRLLEEVWRDVVVEEGNLDTHVSTLRKALAEAPGAIETVRGFGYRFAAAVERESGVEATPIAAPATVADPPSPREPISLSLPVARTSELDPEPPATAALPSPNFATVEAPTIARPRPARHRRSLAVALALLAAAAVAALVVPRFVARRAERKIAPEPTAVGVRSLAVLPFENLSKRPDDAWIASALREVLSSEAARSGGVSALPGDTVVRLAADLGMPAGATLPGAAVTKFRERLGVDLLLAGTYLVVGPTRELRVDLQLYDATSGRSRRIWNESGHVDGLLELVARAGDELRAELGAAAIVGEPATSALFPAASEPLRLYTTGLAELRADEPQQALELFQRAVEAEPGFALARGALAGVLGQLGRERDARAEARRALELAGGLPEADRLELEGRLLALTNQWTLAVAVRRRQMERDPESLDFGLELSRALTNANQAAEASEVLDRLAALPPPKGDDARIDLERGWAARRLNDFAAMRASGERAVAKGRALGSELLVAQGLVLVSWADLTLNQWRDGLAACEEGARIATRLEHGFLIARHQGLCGWNHLNLSEFDQAEADFVAALDRARASGDLDQIADFLYGLGMLASNRGRPAEQLRLDREQLAVAREAGDVEAEVQALGGVADAQLENGELEAAEATAREAVELARRTVSAGRLSNVITTLALVRQARGDTDEALALFREAIELRERTPARAGLLFIEVGRTELVARRPESALAAAAEAERLLSPDDALAFTRVAALRADALSRLGRRDEALAELQTFETRFRALSLAAGLAGGLDLARAEILDTLGRRDEAAALWREVVRRPELADLGWLHLESAYRLARQAVERNPSAAAEAELRRLTEEARAKKYGGLIGEKL